MSVGLRKPSEIYKQMGLSNEDIARVKERVYAMIDLLKPSEIDGKLMPEVSLTPESISSYDGERNIINIAVSGIDNGESYAAEVGHFLRAYGINRLGKKQEEDVRELKVEEFVDRASSIIARKRAKGTNLEPLFSKPKKNYSTIESRKELADNIKEAKKDKDTYILGLGDRNVLHWRTHTSYSYADQYDAKDLETEPLYEMTDNEIRKKFFHKIREKKKSLEGTVGVFLGIGLAVFIVSLILVGFGLTGNLVENSVTGSVVGSREVVGWGVIGLVLCGLVFSWWVVRRRML